MRPFSDKGTEGWAGTGPRGQHDKGVAESGAGERAVREGVGGAG